MSKRILSLVLALVMVLGTFGTVFAAETAAVTVEKDAATFLKESKVLLGDDKGDLNLDLKLERRDMVILLSRLMGEEEVAAKFPTEVSPTWEDARTDAYYTPFFAWGQVNKFFEGKTAKAFGPREAMTAQDYSLVLLRALGYEVTGHDAWKAALKDAKELGILANVVVEDATEITRGQMSVMTLNTLGAKVKDSTKTLAEELGIKLPVPAVLEVEEVAADNLKEIKVVFNKEVDRDSVEDKDNYSTTVGTLKDAKLVEGNTVILTLVDNVKMTNKKEYKLNIRGIKDGNSSVNSEFKFVAMDNAIPEVVEVTGLGTKAIKVVMSEPVQDVKSSSFVIDGKTYYGSVNVTGREIILKPYGSNFGIGEHTLVVKSLKDFADFKSVEREFKFEIIEDKETPTVVEAKGTLERVIVTFSEDVDDATVSRDSLYWGGTKNNKAEKVVRLSGNRYAFEFTAEKSLPTYEVALTVSGVKDYSGNEMKSADVAFKAEIDTTRPEIVEVKIEDGNLITVRFNKSVNVKDVEKRENFTLVDSDGKKVSIKVPAVSAKDSRVVTVGLYSDLKENKDYTLKISGLRDNTKLQNTMLPYEEKISAGNYKNPKAEDTVIPSVSGDILRLQVTFNKKMDIETISQASNYFVAIAGREYSLSVIDGDVEVVQDGKVAILVLPEEVKLQGDTTKTKIVNLYDSNDADKNKITYVKVLAVKDLSGNILNNYGEALKVAKGVLEIEKEAVATDNRTIEVNFNQNITNANRDNFDLAGRTIDRIVTNGTKKVVLELTDRENNKLNSDLIGEKLTVEGKMETVLGNLEIKKTLLTVESKDLKDEIKPTLLDNVEVVFNGNKLEFTLTFDENIQESKFAPKDFVITRTDNKKFDTNKMTSGVVGNKVTLTTTELIGDEKAHKASDYEIDTIKNPGAIRDIANNSMNELERPIIVGSKQDPAATEKEADQKAADAVVVLIDKLDAVITLENKVDVENARKAYDALNSEAKKLVADEKLNTLKAAEAKIIELEKADADKNEAAIIKNVQDKIAAIKEPVTLEQKTAVVAARKAYNNLTVAQAAEVNVAKLVAAETTIGDLETAAAAEATATAAVVKAEGSQLQVDVDAAQGLVDALAAGAVKTDLLARIVAITVTP